MPNTKLVNFNDCVESVMSVGFWTGEEHPYKKECSTDNDTAISLYHFQICWLSASYVPISLVHMDHPWISSFQIWKNSRCSSNLRATGVLWWKKVIPFKSCILNIRISRCFFLSDTKLEFDLAKSDCEDRRYSLVTITDLTNNNYLQSKIFLRKNKQK